MKSPFSFSLWIALRYLWSKRAEAFITIISVISVIGVAIGVTVLTIVMAVMTGFEKELKEKITGTNSHIIVRSVSGFVSDWRPLKAAVEKLPAVSSVSPFTQYQALIRTKEKASGLLVRGVARGTASARQLGTYLSNGTETDAAEPEKVLFEPPPLSRTNEDGTEVSNPLPAIVIGRELARNMGLFVGSTVSLLTPQVASSPFGLVPRFKRFVVSGIYSSGLIEYESGLAYLSLEESQRFFDKGDEVSGLEVRVNDLDHSAEVAHEMMGLPEASNRGLYAQDWRETSAPLWAALKLEKQVYFLVLLLIIIMASFSIVTTLIMLVLEKRRDIAVLRTLGASSQAIWRVFFLQGAIIGAAGTVLGLFLGLGGCLLLRKYGFPLDERIFQMSQLPVVINEVNFAIVGVSAFVICCVATIYPARRASRLSPSEILRHE